MSRKWGHILSALGILGNLLYAIKLPIPGFLIFIVANSGWLLFIKRTGEMREQRSLWWAYNFLNVLGLIIWGVI